MFEGHNGYIASAYGVTALVLIGLIASTIWRNKRDIKRLEKIEQALQDRNK